MPKNKTAPSKSDKAADAHGEVKDLKAKVARLEKKVASLQAKLDSRTADAAAARKKAKKVAKEAAAEVDKFRAKAAKARRKARAVTQDSTPATLVEPEAGFGDIPVKGSVEPLEADPAVLENAPDETWTLTRLRAEARGRGLAGYSRKSKAELLAALNA